MGRTVAAISGDSSPSPSPSPSSSSSSSAESSFRELDDVFLQTQTRIWLGEVLHTRLDDQLNISELLADGELLFEVSKVVWTMLLAKSKELRHVNDYKCNPIGSRKSSGKYRPYSNVESFFKICKILGLNSVDLFSPSDVVGKRDTRKVCTCIRSLSKKARFKRLKVPDFDIVTHTVAMPTNMVGGLRRSLELSKCNSASSANYTPRRDSKLKSRQKNHVAASDRNYDSCSEASDDIEGNYMGVLTYSSSANYSDDTAMLKDTDESPGVYSQSASCIGVSHANNGENSHEIGGLDHSADSGLDFCINDSIDGNSLDDMADKLYISPQLAFPDIVLGLDNENILFDGEDSVYNLLLATDSYGSNSTGRTWQNRFGRRSSDDFEDVEVSSVSSMSSILGRVLNLDFEDQFDVGDLRSSKVSLTDLQNCEADEYLDGSLMSQEIQNIEQCEYALHGSSFDIEKTYFQTENRELGLSTKFCLPYSKNQSHGYEEQAGSSNKEFDVSQINSRPALLKDSKFTVSDNAEKQKLNCGTKATADPDIRDYPKSCLTLACGSNITGEKYEVLDSLDNGPNAEETECYYNLRNKFDDNHLKNEDICSTEFTSEDQNKCEDVENLTALSDGEEDIKKRPSKNKPHKRPLLQTVVKGTAVFGMMFLLLQLRNRRGSENGNEANKKSCQIQQTNGMENTIKLQKRGRENGVYPADKFKFQN